jgi:hypothetical protein
MRSSGKSKAAKTQTTKTGRKTTAATKRTTKSAAAAGTTKSKARRATKKVAEPFPLVAAAETAVSAPTAGRPGIRDNVLGRLEWNDELKSYHGKIEYRGQSVDVTLIPNDSPESLDSVIDRARDVVSRLDAYVERAQEMAAAKLHDAECCPSCTEEVPQQPAEQPVIAQFSKAMRLKSVEFRAGGRVTFLHDDGNSFWGNLVEVTLGADDQLSVARPAA